MPSYTMPHISRLGPALLTLVLACGDSPTNPPGGGPDDPGDNPGTPGDSPLTPPDDPLLVERWYLHNFGQTIGGSLVGTPDVDIRALEAWRISRGAGVIVAVLDAGVAVDHPAVRDRLVPGWDFVDDDPDPEDVRVKSVRDNTAKLFHGTAVADAVLSIAPEARIMPLRVIGNGIQDEDVAAAVRFARDNGAKIVNMSFATFVPGFGYPQTAQAIAEAPGLLFVAGAGNEGNNADITRPEPCTLALPNVLCVAATDEHDDLAIFRSGGSNYGPQNVHIAAPGDNFLVAQPPIRTVHSDGFSEASPWSTEGQSAWTITSEAGFSGSTSLEYTRAPADAAHVRAPIRQFAEAPVRMIAPVTLAGEQGCYLSFRYWSDLDGTYSVALESSRDGVTFTLRPGANGFAFAGPTFGEWREAYVPLDIEMEAGTAYFGFLMNDLTGTSGHFRVDDFEVTCNDEEYDDDLVPYAFAEGTSFAAPLAAGVGATVASPFPELAPPLIIETITGGGRPAKSSDIPPTTMTGAVLDAQGALQLAAVLAQAPGAPASVSPPGGEPAGGGAGCPGSVKVGHGLRTGAPLAARITRRSTEARAAGELIELLEAIPRLIEAIFNPRPPSAGQLIKQDLTFHVITDECNFVQPVTYEQLTGVQEVMNQVAEAAEAQLQQLAASIPTGQGAIVGVDIVCQGTCTVAVHQIGPNAPSTPPPPPEGPRLKANSSWTGLEGVRRFTTTVDGTG